MVASSLQASPLQGPHAKLPTIFSGLDLASFGDSLVEDEAYTPIRRLSKRLSSGSWASTASSDSEDPGSRPASEIFSAATSTGQYAEPAQTLICLDWDDTLFPTTELFGRWELPRASRTGPTVLEGPLPQELQSKMERWREAIYQCLCCACCLSDRCAIVTNSVRPWVDDCVKRFAPELQTFFDHEKVHVVYADEAFRASMRPKTKTTTSCCAGISAWVRDMLDEKDDADQLADQQTAAKLAGMQREASAFYSRYPGQTWKNIISVGDMRYEHDALHELSSSRARACVPRERLRTKSVLLPTGPSLNELILRLSFLQFMLPVCVRFDGAIDLDFRTTLDPLKPIAQALKMPALSGLQIPGHAFGLGPAMDDDEVTGEALDEFVLAMQDFFLHFPVGPVKMAA